jgi:hypothetical protein
MADTAHAPRLSSSQGDGHRRFFALPHTALGRWSVALLALFWFFLALFYAYVALEIRDSGDAVARWPLWATMIPAAVSGVAAFITGWTSVFARGERSLLVLLASAWGTFVVWFITMELMFPH